MNFKNKPVIFFFGGWSKDFDVKREIERSTTVISRDLLEQNTSALLRFGSMLDLRDPDVLYSQ